MSAITPGTSTAEPGSIGESAVTGAIDSGTPAAMPEPRGRGSAGAGGAAPTIRPAPPATPRLSATLDPVVAQRRSPSPVGGNPYPAGACGGEAVTLDPHVPSAPRWRRTAPGPPESRRGPRPAR